MPWSTNMAVLETSFLIDILRNEPIAVKHLYELEQNEKELFITSPTIMELWEGALLCNMPQKEKTKIEALLTTLTELPLDSTSAKRAAEISVYLSKRGQTIDTEDIMIAGISLSTGEKIITSDEHFTRIPGLSVLKYR